MKEAQRFGSDLVTQGINKLSEEAIKKGVPADTVHKVSNVVREGAHRAVDKLSSVADKQIDKLGSQKEIQERNIHQAKSRNKRRRSKQNQAKVLKNSQPTVRPTKYRNSQPISKRVKYSLQNDIEES